jgi:hypothetical protein
LPGLRVDTERSLRVASQVALPRHFEDNNPVVVGNRQSIDFSDEPVYVSTHITTTSSRMSMIKNQTKRDQNTNQATTHTRDQAKRSGAAKEEEDHQK